MKSILKYISSLLLLFFFTLAAYSQNHKYLPSQLRIGTDLSYLGLSVLSNEKSQFELNADIDFNRFIITGDYGYASWMFEETTYLYDNEGYYYRIGVDYNFIEPAEDQNAIYIGFKYAGTQFNESFIYQFADPFYGDYTKEIQDLKRTGSWLEIVTGMKIRLWKGLYMGWTGRFKFVSTISSSPASLINYWIPGFGKTTKESRWGLNYQIFYRFPLFKKKYRTVEILEEE
jgi:hypothetical protein